jgi:hypothetical protein
MIPEHFSDADAAAHMRKHPACQIRCKEEAYYHKLFIEVFPQHAKMQDNIARWAQRPPEITAPGTSFTN